MHVLPAERSDHRVIDGERVCDATASQTLRNPRAAQTVTTERDGRIIRYQPADTPVAQLITTP